MKLYYFSEMPHHEYPDAEGAKYPSLRLDFPRRLFDREKASANDESRPPREAAVAQVSGCRCRS